MPRKTKPIQSTEAPVDEAQLVEQANEAQPTQLTKEDYNKARATIKQFREAQKSKPKRKCSEKQLAALAAGRMKNKRLSNKSTGTNQ